MFFMRFGRNLLLVDSFLNVLAKDFSTSAIALMFFRKFSAASGQL
jgi:hypothetical protein